VDLSEHADAIRYFLAACFPPICGRFDHIECAIDHTVIGLHLSGTSVGSEYAGGRQLPPLH
jgi:hypothetical protein